MLFEIVIFLITGLFLFHWWAHGYWKRRGVFSIPAEPVFGSVRDLLFEKATMYSKFGDIYKKHKQHGLIGFYAFYKPMLFVTDPELVKQVLVTEFNSFSDGGFVMEVSVDPIMGRNPFAAKGHAYWKEVRGIQTTMQTPFKLKELVPGIIKVGGIMTDFIMKHQEQPIDIKDLATRYTVGSAVLSAFGMEPNSFTDPEFAFMKHASGDKLFDPMSSWSSFAPFFLPTISKILSARTVSKEAEMLFTSTVRSIIVHREKTQTSRGDLIDTIRRISKKKLEQNNEAVTPTEMGAHCASFYFDATATLAEVMCFTMLELANHPDIQEKLRREIESVGKTLEDFDYDKIHSITYLQMVIDESMRIHPPVTMLSRLCTKEMTLNDVRIEEGIKVFVSPYALHHDPDYYPEPDEFKPERFSEENRESRAKYTFLPFGEGPRICVGSKYALLALKVSLMSMLLKFKIVPMNGPQKVKYSPSAIFILTIPSGVTLKFEEL